MLCVFHQAVGEKGPESGWFHPFTQDGEYIVPGFPSCGVGLGTDLGQFHFRLIYALLLPFSTVNSAEIIVFIIFF